MSLTASTDEITALKEALAQANEGRADAIRHSQSLASQLLLARTERDLLKERLNKFMRRIFAAKSEASSHDQKDMFFNEAEALGAQAQPAAQEEPDSDGTASIDVPAHKRAKRGRKPLDPILPRHVVRHELPESERTCPHDGTPLIPFCIQ